MRQTFPLLGQLAAHVLSTRGELGVLPRPLCQLLGARLELAELPLLQLPQLRAPLQPGAFLRDVGGVVAGVALDATLFQLEDAVGRAVDEVAVVGDDGHRPPVVPHVSLQPGLAREVEVVVRLVEEEHVWLLDQQPRQPDQLLLPATELTNWLIAPRRGESESTEHAVALRRLSAVIEPFQDHRVGIHDGRQLLVVGGLAHHLLELARSRLEYSGIAGGEGDRLAHRLTGIEIGLLAEEPDAGTARQRECPALRPQLPGHQPEEGALA